MFLLLFIREPIMIGSRRAFLRNEFALLPAAEAGLVTGGLSRLPSEALSSVSKTETVAEEPEVDNGRGAL